MLLEHLFLTAWKQGTHTHCFKNLLVLFRLSHSPHHRSHLIRSCISIGHLLQPSLQGLHQRPTAISGYSQEKGAGTVFKLFHSVEFWLIILFHLTPKSILTKVQPQNFVGHWRIGWTSQIPPSLLVSALESQRGTRPKKVKLHWERGRAHKQLE